MLSIHIVYGFIEAAFELFADFDESSSDAEFKESSTFCI